jgi:signal recognition particle receptor subunit beta
MSLVNHSTKEITAKIVYYGPGRCGKTTNLQYVFSRLPEERRGKIVSLATEKDRTLFFDFLPLDVGPISGFQTRFQLYTVPGQVYYNATRRLVLQGADGVVFVADSQRSLMDENRESLDNLRENLSSWGMTLEELPLVFQYNKRDLPDIALPSELARLLDVGSRPAFEGVAVQGQGVLDTLRAIGFMVMQRLAGVEIR